MADQSDTIDFAASLTVAWLSNPNTRADADQVPEFLRSMHEAVSSLVRTEPAASEDSEQNYEPAVSVRKSLASPEHILSMIDGKPYRTLTRHLSTHGLTPDEYRERYGLKPDYPMVAPAYSEKRRAFALAKGLGRKPGSRAGGSKGNGSQPKAASAAGKRNGAAAARKAAKAHLGTEGA